MNKEYAEEVAARIIEQLRQGTAPWQKPWKPGELRLPYNAATGNEYRGMNTIWLHMQGYDDPRWVTYRQAEMAGAQVRKGSRGTRIIYWKFHDEQPMTDAQGRPVLDDEGKQRKIRVELERPRVFSAVVFNAQQIDGLPPLEAKPLGSEPERHARAEAILAKSGARIAHVEGDRAFYSLSTDSITLPARHQFGSADAYYATALHELGHYSGHESRLNRDLSHPFGSEGYAREELRAEIASLMIGERLEIGHDPGQHAAYVASWIKVLQDDPREIFRAAADAEKINSYVLAFEQVEQEQTQSATAPDPVTVEIGQRVRFTPNEERAAQGGMTIEGMAVDVARTQAGNLRCRIRTDQIAPQDGQPQEWLVYSNQGRIEQLPARDVAAGPTPEAEAALQAAHREAVPTYSPLETWQNLDAVARELGLVAAVRLIDGADAETFRAPFQVSYTRLDGTPTSITTGIFTDGKALTGANGERVSPFITEDHESQSSDLRTALSREREQGPTVQHTPPEASTMTPQRTYLIVPYRQKDEAKKLAQDAGFRLQWDKEVKQWFAPEGVDVKQTALARWLPENTKVAVERAPSPEQSFADAIRAAGLKLDGLPEMDGQIHRVGVEGDKGAERSGSYAGHMEGRIPGGYIQNYKTGERINWKYEGKVNSISPEERERLNREAVERADRRAVAVAAQHDAMAKIAQAVWDEAPPATGDHPYCVAKGITHPGEHGLRVVPSAVSDEAKAAGVRIAKNWREAKAMREAEPEARVFIAGDLLVPARDRDGKLWSVQSVNPNFKGFMKDGRKTGNYTIAGAEPSAFAAMMDRDPSIPLVLAEGYATGDTTARLRGHPVVVGFDSGNLDAVARGLRDRWPNRPLLIAADNDHTAEQKMQPNGKPGVNVGLKKAQEVAANHKGAALVPPFGPRDKGTDWNDYAQQHGDEAARKELARQVAQAKTEAAMNAERMMTLAREREAEARNDPTTSADDAFVARERAAAHDLMARAVAGDTEARAEATDALVANATGAPRPVAAVSTTIDRTKAEQADEVKEQRQTVFDGHNVSSESERATTICTVERRVGDHRPTDRMADGAEWWDHQVMLMQESAENPRQLERDITALGPRPPEGVKIRINEDWLRVIERGDPQQAPEAGTKPARQRARGQGAEL